MSIQPSRRRFWVFVLLCSALPAMAADPLPEALSRRGLAVDGSQLVLPAEDGLTDQLKSIKGIQKKYLDAYRAAQQFDLEVLAARDEFAFLKNREKQLKQQLINAGGNTAKSQAATQALKDDQKLIAEAQRMSVNDREEIVAAFSALKEVRKAYIDAIRELWNTAVDAKKAYAEIGADSEATKALDELNKSASKPLTMGPTRFFENNYKAAEKYNGFVRTGSIPVTKNTWNYIPVSINGKANKPVSIAPGYNTVFLSEKTAADFGITPNDYDPISSFLTASRQSSFKTKRVLVSSIKVGDFEIENATVHVFDSDSDNQDDRFGGGFLRYFDWNLDESALTLTLTEVKDSAVKPLSFKSKKKR